MLKTTNLFLNYLSLIFSTNLLISYSGLEYTPTSICAQKHQVKIDCTYDQPGGMEVLPEPRITGRTPLASKTAAPGAQGVYLQSPGESHSTRIV